MENEVRTSVESEKVVLLEQRDFPYKDKQDRWIGYSVGIMEEERVIYNPKVHRIFMKCFKPGKYFTVRAQKTKNGEHFGPSYGEKHFISYNEAMNYAAIRVNSLRECAKKESKK